ncbi:Uncharacterised protein [Plesiomonas shigelloides]|nr:Uncharacterised protein [Plesiomonas shigelloides]
MYCHVSNQIDSYAHHSGMADLISQDEMEVLTNMREEFVAKATSGECNEEAKLTIESLCQIEPDTFDRQFIALLYAPSTSIQAVQSQVRQWFEMHAERAMPQYSKMPAFRG